MFSKTLKIRDNVKKKKKSIIKHGKESRSDFLKCSKKFSYAPERIIMAIFNDNKSEQHLSITLKKKKDTNKYVIKILGTHLAQYIKYIHNKFFV